MDILHRKLLKPGDKCYFIRSSVEEPFIYLRFEGEIKEVETTDDIIQYRIAITNILEEYQFLLLHMDNVRFRVKNTECNRYIDKFFYIYSLNTSNFINDFIFTYKKYWFDVPSVFVFTDIQTMTEYLEELNKHLSDKLVSTIKILSNRILNE